MVLRTREVGQEGGVRRKRGEREQGPNGSHSPHGRKLLKVVKWGEERLLAAN